MMPDSHERHSRKQMKDQIAKLGSEIARNMVLIHILIGFLIGVVFGATLAMIIVLVS